jgi:predicted dehydrogenase
VPPHFGGFREEMDHVLLLDMAIHTFDSARFLSGCDPRGVICREWEPKGTWYRQGSAAAAIFEMTGNTVFTYTGSWCADGLRTSWESAWRIVGDKGSLVWDGYDGIRAEARSGGRDGLFDKVEPVDVPPLDAQDRIGGHLGVIEDFLAAVESGKAPETEGADNIRSLAMVFGAIESAESGRYVEITG